MNVLHFEDLDLGGSWTTRGRTITETDIVNHASTSGDWGPLHVNQEFASAGHFGTRVAHGSLLISLAMGLGAMDVPHPATVGMVGTGWRFMRPVRAGDTIRAHYRLSRKRDVDEPRWGLAVWRIEITNQRQEIVAEGEVTVLVTKRDVPHVSIASTASKRHRRGRRGKDPVAVPVEVPAAPSAGANLPEPAPADAPAPSTRRRGASVKSQPDPVAQVVPASPAPSEETSAPTSASARRRRRRRGGSGGSGGTASAEGSQTKGGSDDSSTNGSLAVAPTAEHPVYVPEPEWANTSAKTTPTPVVPISAGPENPIGQILKRFRRPPRRATKEGEQESRA